MEPPVDVFLKDTLSTADLMANEAAFEGLLSKAVAQRLITSEDTVAMNLIHRFFPNSSRFDHHFVSIEPIAKRDSYWLLLYEFISEKEDRNQMFLGSFRKTGNVVDLLEIQSISFDGHLSLNLLEDNILEIEYRDFTIRSNFPDIHANIEGFSPQAVPVKSEPYRQFINNSKKEETAGAKYYRIQEDGSFMALATSNQKQIERIFPQMSSRILSDEELERLKPDELELMRNEMYDCHGFVFEEELLTKFFVEKGWYQPDGHVCKDELNEIEQINLKRMLDLNSVLKKK